jgi:hypothetical protein
VSCTQVLKATKCEVARTLVECALKSSGSVENIAKLQCNAEDGFPYVCWSGREICDQPGAQQTQLPVEHLERADAEENGSGNIIIRRVFG